MGWALPPCRWRNVFQARPASRFSDTWVEIGVASNDELYLPFFDATAEYHRSDESSGSCAWPDSARCVRGAEHRYEAGSYCASGYRGGTRGWDPKFGTSLAGKPAREARVAGLLDTSARTTSPS